MSSNLAACLPVCLSAAAGAAAHTWAVLSTACRYCGWVITQFLNLSPSGFARVLRARAPTLNTRATMPATRAGRHPSSSSSSRTCCEERLSALPSDTHHARPLQGPGLCCFCCLVSCPGSEWVSHAFGCFQWVGGGSVPARAWWLCRKRASLMCSMVVWFCTKD